MTVPQRLSIIAQLSNCNLATWVAVKTSVNSWDHPTFEIPLRFLIFRGFGDHGVSLWNSSSGILGFLVCDQNWENDWKRRESGIGHRLWDFPLLYKVLASHDQRYNESNIGGFNGCSHFDTLNSAYRAFSTFEMHSSIAFSESSE